MKEKSSCETTVYKKSICLVDVYNKEYVKQYDGWRRIDITVESYNVTAEEDKMIREAVENAFKAILSE